VYTVGVECALAAMNRLQLGPGQQFKIEAFEIEHEVFHGNNIPAIEIVTLLPA